MDILIARYLGVADYGVLGFAISITSILSILYDLGIGVHIIRHIATDYDSAPKYLGNSIPLKSIFSLIGFIIIFLVLLIINANEITLIISLLFAIQQIFKRFIDLFNGLFQAFEEGKYQGIGNTILNTLLLLFIILSITTDLGLYGITISYILANLIALIYEYYVLNKHVVKPNFELDRQFCKKITFAALPFAVSAVLYSIYYSIDIVMLTNMVGNYATGIYNATYKLISVLTLFYGVYTAVIFPVMSKFFQK